MKENRELEKIENIMEIEIPIDTKSKEFEKVMFIYQVALKEINMKLEILKDEFKLFYEYDLIDHINTRIKSPESITKKMKDKSLQYTYKEMIKNINAQNVEGVKVVSYKELPEGAKNAMSIVAGADYFVYTDLFTEEQVNDFYAQDEINILKKTKKSEKIVDIKPMIHEMKFNEDGIFMKVSQGSAANLKPDLVMSALEQFTGAKLPEFVQYERMDMYCLENDKLVSLSEIGGNIE